MATTSTDKDDLEPLDPRTAQALFLDDEATNCTEPTVQNHRYRTTHFIDWCEEAGIDTLDELSGRDIQQFRLWRNGGGELNELTLRMQMRTHSVFLKWAASIEAVPEDLYYKVLVPRVRPAERRNLQR